MGLDRTATIIHTEHLTGAYINVANTAAAIRIGTSAEFTPATTHGTRLLKPLEVPGMAWTHISMDFIEGLPKVKGKDVILVVVDRFTKYAHFIALSHPYTVQQVVQLFMDQIFRLHGFPLVIVTDRDRIFTSKLFEEIFKSAGVSLRFSTSYHPQTDGQTERVNQCLENYLRIMAFQDPKE